MDKFFGFLVVVGLIFGLGYMGCSRCLNSDKVDGADLNKMKCAPVLSNGQRNPHYLNSWQSCNTRCRNENKSPNLTLEDCTCICQ